MLQGNVCSRFLHVLSRSAWAAKGLIVFLDCSLTNTNWPLHTISIAPWGPKSIPSTCLRVTRILYTPATWLRKELWSPEFPGVIIDPWIQLIDVVPLITHPCHCSFYLLIRAIQSSNMASAVPMQMSVHIWSTEPWTVICICQSIPSCPLCQVL